MYEWGAGRKICSFIALLCVNLEGLVWISSKSSSRYWKDIWIIFLLRKNLYSYTFSVFYYRWSLRTVSSYILKTAWNRSGSIMRWQTLRMQSAIISVHWWRMREKLLKVCIQIEGWILFWKNNMRVTQIITRNIRIFFRIRRWKTYSAWIRSSLPCIRIILPW